MISVELDKSKTALQILVDKEGAEQLIRHLTYIKENQDDMDLVAGAELDNKATNSENTLIEYINIAYYK